MRSLLIIVVTLAAAIILGSSASRLYLGLIVAALGAILLLRQPALGLVVLVMLALMIPFEISTGTDVKLNLVSFLVPALVALWLLDSLRSGELRLPRSQTFLPLGLFLMLTIVSLLIGNAAWDPFVPRPANFLLVQLAQVALFFLSAGAYFLMASLVKEEKWLHYFVWTSIAVGGGLAVIYILPMGKSVVNRIATSAFDRAPLWVLLASMAGGQLLFNRSLNVWKRIPLIVILAAAGFYSLVLSRAVISIWIGVVAALAALFWLRWPKLRWLVLMGIVILLLSGILFPAIYEFAGGDAEWRLSGQTRIDLSRRVVEVTMRNPITGLGPASYRVYAGIKPLVWRGGSGIWIGALVSSHNNYVDLFSHVGLLGLGIFLWFIAEVALLGLRLRKRFDSGFASGYINGALSALVGSMVLMGFADWFLPFVYNIGYSGFQASVLVWMFLGGLIVFEGMAKDSPEKQVDAFSS